MSGLFDALPTPEERQLSVLTKALELRREQWQHRDGYAYEGGADLLLRHGQFYIGRKLPEEYAQHAGPEGNCFNNAMVACEADPTLRYVEGVYTVGAGNYTGHAWCLDPQGRLLEVTYPTSDEEIARGRERASLRPVLAPEHWGYWGAVFHIDLVKAVWQKQNEEVGVEDHVGMLDRNPHDPQEWFSEPGGGDEWRENFPVLTVPYSPDRRTL